MNVQNYYYIEYRSWIGHDLRDTCSDVARDRNLSLGCAIWWMLVRQARRRYINPLPLPFYLFRRTKPYIQTVVNNRPTLRQTHNETGNARPMSIQEKTVSVHPQPPSPGLSSSWSSVNHRNTTASTCNYFYGFVRWKKLLSSCQRL